MAWALTQNKNPKSPSKAKLVWHVDRYSELTGLSLENLDKYSLPFTPTIRDQDPGITLKGPKGETFARLSDFIRLYEKQVPTDNIVVQMPQSEVMTNGYGRNIKLENFPLVNAFLNNKITDANKAPLNTGSYSFKDLLARKVLVDNKNITANDRVIAASFYGGTITLRTNDWFEDAYVHGTVGFALMDSTKFIVTARDKRVDAEVGALDDNWDLNSNSPTARLVNNLLYAAGFGVYNNMTISLEYYGSGKRLSITR